MSRIVYPSAPVYVQSWPEGTELCPTCGQPDNCGDCTHGVLSQGDVIDLGGQLVPASTLDLRMYRILGHDERDDNDVPLYWSNDLGWTGIEDASVFNAIERRMFNLTFGGEWEVVKEGGAPS